MAPGRSRYPSETRELAIQSVTSEPRQWLARPIRELLDARRGLGRPGERSEAADADEAAGTPGKPRPSPKGLAPRAERAPRPPECGFAGTGRGRESERAAGGGDRQGVAAASTLYQGRGTWRGRGTVRPRTSRLDPRAAVRSPRPGSGHRRGKARKHAARRCPVLVVELRRWQPWSPPPRHGRSCRFGDLGHPRP